MKKIKLSGGCKIFIAIIGFLVFFTLIAITSSMSYEDEVNGFGEYCSMVSKGYWPNYNKNINCEK